MKKTPANTHVSSAPMRVLLNNRSEKVLKESFNEDLPNSLAYNMDDFHKLKDLFLAMGPPENISLTRVWIFMQDLDTFDCSGERDIFFKFHKKRKDDTLGQVYTLLFKVPIKDVPLYINHPYLSEFAKWRLIINK